MNQAIFMVPKNDRYGIGYQFNNYERKRCSERKSRQVNFRGQKRGDKSFSRPPLYPMFQSSGYLAPNPFAKSKDAVTILVELAINATREDQETIVDAPPAVYPCPPNFELNNWKAVEISIVYKQSE